MPLPAYYAHVTLDAVAALLNQTPVLSALARAPCPIKYALFCRALFTFAADQATVSDSNYEDATYFLDRFVRMRLGNEPLPATLLGLNLGDMPTSDISPDRLFYVLSKISRQCDNSPDLIRYLKALELMEIRFHTALPLVIAQKHKIFGSAARIAPEKPFGLAWKTGQTTEAFLCEFCDFGSWPVDDEVRADIVQLFRDSKAVIFQDPAWTFSTMHLLRGLIDADYANNFKEFLVRGDHAATNALLNIPGEVFLTGIVGFAISKMATGELSPTPIAGDILNSYNIKGELRAQFGALMLGRGVEAAEAKPLAATRRAVRATI